MKKNNPVIDIDLRKSVLKILDTSPEVQDSVGTKRHLRWWYHRGGESGEISSAGMNLINSFINKEFKEKLKNEIILDYQGGNGVLCLYLNILGYNTYFHDMDSKEARYLLSHFNLQNKIIDNREDLFNNTPPITVAMSVEWSLNDDLGDPITDINSLKYLIIDNFSDGSQSNKSCKKIDSKRFPQIIGGKGKIKLMYY
tara:strand:- start:71 stop:664 length:594 start_codon:yes stop_codon:yes gene_type:complete